MEDLLRFRIEPAQSPYHSEEFEAGYSARFCGQSYCCAATRGWKAGWMDADFSLICRYPSDTAWLDYCGLGAPAIWH